MSDSLPLSAPRSRSRWSHIIAILLGIAFILFGIWFYSTSPSSPAELRSPVSTSTVETAPKAPTSQKIEIKGKAVLQALSGQATVLRAGKAMEARENLVLIEGDTLTVAEGGDATVFWPEYGKTNVAGGTSVQFTKLEQSEQTGSLAVSLKLMTGRVWTRLEKLLDAESSFDVQANDVVATVRGTSFGVRKQDKKVQVQVMQHKVEITRRKKVIKGMMVNEHRQVEIGDEDLSNKMALGWMSKKDEEDAWVKASNKEMSKEELSRLVPSMSDDEIPTTEEMQANINAAGFGGEETSNEVSDEPTATKPATRPKTPVKLPTEPEAEGEPKTEPVKEEPKTETPPPAKEPVQPSQPADEPPPSDPAQTEIEAALERTDAPADGSQWKP